MKKEITITLEEFRSTVLKVQDAEAEDEKMRNHGGFLYILSGVLFARKLEEYLFKAEDGGCNHDV